MRNVRIPALIALCLGLFLVQSSFAQQKTFEWQPANDESVRLDPANYHTGRTYHPGSGGGSLHVNITAQKPITIFMTPEAAWNRVLQDPRAVGGIPQLCLREHVVDALYECDLPAEPMTLVMHDERNSPDAAVFAVMGAALDPHDKTDRAVGAVIASVMTGHDSPVNRRFVSPNDAHIQYFRWVCIENCIEPSYQWMSKVKEKYDLTSLLKLYGGYTPGFDGARVHIKIKSPVAMAVAMVPSSSANRLYAQPDTLQSVLANAACQQRAAQSLEFNCTFDASDGPQSLIAVPETPASVPKHKKAEIEMSAVECVANCEIVAEKH
jgi:hypothetical protein